VVLADGTELEGEAAGWWDPETPAPASGEVVFNTALSGYQEILTDPSYSGQIVTFTYPHIGNYGVNAADDESRRSAAAGLIVRDLTERPSNWRATGSLQGFLERKRIPAVTGVDTRRLTRHLRDHGAIPGAFAPVEGDAAVPEDVVRAAAATARPTDGQDLVAGVTTDEPYVVGAGPLSIVAYDFGIKTTILSHLGRLGRVEVVPARTSATDALARQPDGVFLSNGPGDPAALPHLVEVVRGLLGRIPIFGICLGHQLLAMALGGETFKLAFGHHGGNHPVQRVATGAVEITSQNHNYAVAVGGDGVEVTHVNLNDGVVEGIAVPAAPALGVQYHPEAGPGPHDSGYLFEEFRTLMVRGS
jgi:carbamoyl-phosphate synthase small subunit